MKQTSKSVLCLVFALPLLELGNKQIMLVNYKAGSVRDQSPVTCVAMI